MGRLNLREPRTLAMTLSLTASLLMLAGKLVAYFLTESEAIFSDAAESVIHLVATGFVAFSLWYAVQPPDTGHLYGHGKIAYFAAGVEGVLILGAAAVILVTAARALVEGPAIHRLDEGLLLLVLLTAVNLVLGLYLIRAGRRHNTLVLVSNGQHVLTDMWTSLGVIGGLLLVRVTGVLWIDPLVAIAVAFNILWTATKLLRRAFEGLMEKADVQETRRIVHALDETVRRGTISGYHQLRHRRVNDRLWIECHLHFPEDYTLARAHARAHAVEEVLQALFPADHVYVTTHLEPESHEEAHPSGHTEPDDPLDPRTL